MSKKNFEEYLNPSYFCDSENEDLISKAKQLTEFDDTPKHSALSIFYFVRDQIKYILDGFTKASETLQRGSGDCGNKANLQVALLRAIKIPARFHIARISKEFLEGVVSKSVYNIIPDVIKYHPWCECYHSNRWISCDSLFDISLMKGLYKKKIITEDLIPTIEWDGFHDMNIIAPWIIEDMGTIHSLDELIPNLELEPYDDAVKTEKFLCSELTVHMDELRI